MPLPLIHYLYASGLPKYLHKHADGEASWALVTGASDGIGKEMSNELAARGFNVIIHGRNEAKLGRVREELQAAHPQRKFRSVVADASAFTQADIDRITALVAGLPLTILINNVGGTAPLSSNFKHFESTTPTEIQALYSLNVHFPLQLTRALLPQLQALNKPALVLSCGSGAQIGQPYVAAYSGCKGAIHAWNRGLGAELRETKSQVDVTEVVVGATYTQQLQKEKDPKFSANLFMPTANVMARAVLARVGHGHVSVTPHFWHAVQNALLYGLLPASTADGIIAGVLKNSVEVKTE